MELELADRLERHEELGNAENAIRIGGDVWNRGDVVCIYSNPEFGTGLNFACRVRSSDERIEELLDAVIEWFTWHNVTPHVRVSPLSQPADLAALLARRNFVQTEAETQMVLSCEDTEPPTNPRVTVDLVQPGELETWLRVQNIGFGGNGQVSQLSVDLNEASQRAGARAYLARLDGEPAGAAILESFEHVSGIYGVATLPQARGQGVGTAMMRRMIRDARNLAPDPICLQAETASATQRWYERLGFTVVYNRTGWTIQI